MQTKLLAAITPTPTCDQVTGADLAAITSTLDLSDASLGILLPHDLDNLTGLTGLNLSGNSLIALPAGIFDDLGAVTTLDLSGNHLDAGALAASGLTSRIFAPMASLVDLDLSDNALVFLPDGIFAGLTAALTNLDLRNQNGIDDNLKLNLMLTADSTANTVTVDAPAGAPAALTVPLTVTDDSSSALAETLTLPLGATSVTNTLTLTGDVAVTSSGTPSWASGTTVQGLDFDFTSGICDRTPKVQAELLVSVKALDGVDSDITCGGVTDTMLRGITDEFRLYGQTVASLKANDFVGLSNINLLNIAYNNLTELPADVFNGLTSVVILEMGDNQLTTFAPGTFNRMPMLQRLDLSANRFAALPDDLFTGRTLGLVLLSLNKQFGRHTTLTDLPVLLVQHNNEVTLTLPMGAPNTLTVNLTITSIPAATTFAKTIEIATGHTSATFTLTPAAGETQRVAFASSNAFSHDSLTLQSTRFVGVLPGICGRSLAVQTAIIATVSAANCGVVTDEVLEGITGTLDLSGSISALLPGDLAGLTGLTGLNLSGNALAAGALPAGIFDDLGALTTLDLSGNALDADDLAAGALSAGALAAGAFAPLTALVDLDLSDNSLTFLPEGIFTGLTVALTDLDLRSQNGLDGNLQLDLMLTGDSTTDTIAVDATAGVPAALTVPVTVTDDLGPQSQALTVPLSEIGVTEALTLTGDVTVTSSGTPSWASGTTVQGLDFNFTFGICDRTDEVQAELLIRAKMLTGVDSSITCGGVTDTMLSSITGELDLGAKTITALQANDFAGLSSIDTLTLSENALTDLPEGVFNGITSVTDLQLQKNKIATIAPGVFNRVPLTSGMDLSQNALAALPKNLFTGRTAGIGGLTLSDQFAATDDNIATQPMVDIPVFLIQDGNHLTATLPVGAPNTLRVNLTITNSPANTTFAGAIVIPIGQTSGTATLRPPAGITQRAAFASSSTFSHSSLTLTDARFVGQILGICDRSAAVQTAIIATPQVTSADCGAVTDEVLGSITGTLDLSSASLSALQAGDLAGLTALQGLNLSDNSLTALPADLFDDLGALTKLDLSGNHLAAGSLTSGDPAVSTFAPLAALVDLDLRDNRIETLPDGTFTGLALPLTKLDLRSQNDSGGTALGGNLKMLVKPSWASGTIRVAVPTGVPAPLTVALDAVGGAASSAAVTLASSATTGTTPLAVSAPSTAVWLSLSAAPSFSGATVSGLDFETGICARNVAVQAKLVAAITPAKNCAEIDAAALATITTALDLSDLGIAALTAGDLAGLTELTALDLTGNALTTLPAGVFEDLAKVTTLTLTNNKLSDSAPSVFATMAALATLDIEGNEFGILPENFFKGLSNELTLDAGLQFNDNPDSGGSDIAEANSIMPLSVGQNSANEVTVDFPAAAFANLRVNLDLFAAAEGLAGNVTVAVGDNSNAPPLPLTAVAGSTPIAAINTTIPAMLASGSTAIITGVTYQPAPRGICNRNPIVQAALLTKIGGGATCGEVATSTLRGLAGTLDLSVASGVTATITTLQASDFADLILIAEVDLGNQGLTAIGANLFSALAALTTLKLPGNSLTELPDHIFAGLGALTTLDLSGNLIATVPNSPFAGLTALTTLDLSDNQLASIANGFLSAATALTSIDLSANLLTEAGLPASAFAALGSLTTVRLNDNKLASLPANLFLGMTSDLTTLDLSDQDHDNDPNSATQDITVTLQVVLSNAGAQVLLPTGAPTDLNMNLTLTNGSANPTRVSISGGDSLSGASTITASGAMIPTIAAALSGSLPAYTAASGSTPASGYGGLTIATAAAVAQNAGICGRTQQVQDAILASVNQGRGAKTPTDPSYVFCNDVGAAHLATITTLNLIATTPAISTLLAGDFAGLTALADLDLSDNELETLPANLFAGVTSLTSLDLSGQTSANTGIILSLRPSIEGTNAHVLLPVGAPTTLTLALSATGGTITSTPATVTIAAGATKSSNVTVAADNDPNTSLIVSIPSDPTFTDTTLTGVFWDRGALGDNSGGICPRTEQVRTQLLGAINGSTLSTSSEYVPCFEVTNAHLAAITALDLSSQTITTLAAGDFAGLTGLTSLDLSDNRLTGTLAAATFTPLTALQTLDLSGTGDCTTGNCLTTLESGQFTGLTELLTLDLSGNTIATLTDGSPFTGLTKLTTLNLSGNALTALPATPFTGSPALTALDLSENKLASLPAALLAPLTKIATLKLGGNLLTALPAGFFVGTSTLTTLSLENQGNDTGETALAAIPLTLRPVATSTTASVLLATGAPTDLTLTLSVTDSGSTSNSAAITIAAGATASSTVTVPSAAATVSPNAPTYDSTNFTGLAWLTSGSTSGGAGICGRTVAVQDALLVLINGDTQVGTSGYKYCQDVVTSDLTGLSGTLDLSTLSIAAVLSTDFTHLTGITTLDLSGNSLTALTDGVFAALTALTSLDLSTNQLTGLGAGAFTGLTKLETLNLRANQLQQAQIDAATLAPLTALTGLDLHGNELTGLPAGLFSGVSTLTSLDLRDQFGNDDQTPTASTVTLNLVPLVRDTTVQVQAPSGAPTALTVPLAVTDGTLDPTSVTIAAGALTSGNSTLTPDAGAAVSNTISITAAPTYTSANASTSFLGIRWEISATANPAGGICERTAQVQTALLALVNGATASSDPGYQYCQDIDDTELAALTGELDLSDAGITELSSSDFAGLTGLTTLTLTGNTELTGLPTDIFVGLSALTTLDLSGNGLTTLPMNPFNGLTAATLTSIDLSGNALTALTAQSVSSLTALTTLDLKNNAIASLAGGTLAPFAATLTTLHLQGNELTALPAGFFKGATALTTLNAGLQTSTDADISLALEPVFDGGDLRLLLATGAPVELTLSLTTTSGTLTPTSLTIAAGATLSGGASTLSYSGTAPTVSITAAPTVANTITGLAWDITATATPAEGICGRTAQVRDALLALINGDTALGDSSYVACQDATASLASLTGTLDLSAQSITALKAGDFAGLTALTGLDLSGNTALATLPASPFSALAALTSLDLSGNALTTLAADLLDATTALTSLDLSGNRIDSLPAGFFSDLTSLTSLDASGQDHDGDGGTSTPVRGITLTIRPLLSGDKISLLLPAGAPTGLTVPLAITGGTAAPSTLTFAVGDTLSNQATFTAVAQSGLSIGVARAPTYNATAFAGLRWDTSATLDPSAGICSRTAAVKDALVALVNGATAAGAPGYKYCQDIVAGDLTALTGELDLSAAGITQLLASDFADLSGITSLDLSDNALTSLPTSPFAALTKLTHLHLQDNSLTGLSASFFSGLGALTTLNLRDNDLTGLPGGFFAGVTTLTSLDLSDQVSDGNNLAIALTPVYLSGTAQVLIATAAPVALSVVLTPYNAGNTALATQTLTIAAGATLSGLAADLPATAIQLGIAAPTGAALTGVSGVTWTLPASRLDLSNGICGRQGAVLAALLAALNTGKTVGDSDYLYCQDVTDAHLATVTGLDLGGQTLTGLQASDFADLSALASLDLSDTTLTSLPSGLFDALAALTTLDLSDNALTSLAAADFAGLSGLTSLDLSDNRLPSLPASFFTGMPALTALDLSGQDHDSDGGASTPARDITLTLTPAIADLQVRVRLLTGAPTDLDIALTATGGTLTPINPAPAQSASQSSAQSAAPAPAGPDAVPALPDPVPASGHTVTVRIAAGSTTSTAALFTSDTDPSTDPQVAISADPTLPASFMGLGWNRAVAVIPKDGICPRTAQVTNALLAALNGATPPPDPLLSCDDVVAAQLAALAVDLDLSPDAPGLAASPPITTLKPGDFANLTAVTGLDLSGNRLTRLPETIFSGMAALTSLNLSDNRLTSLPQTLFSGMGALTSLNLRDNRLGNLSPTELFGTDGDDDNPGLFGVLDLAKITLLDVRGNPGNQSIALVTITQTGFDRLQIARSPVLLLPWTLPLTISGGQLPQPSVTILAGQALSPEFDIVPETPYTSGTLVGIDTSGNPAPAGFYGFDIDYRRLYVDVGICDRTQQVQDAILDQIVPAATCRDANAQLLAAYDGPLDMAGKSVAALRVGDFTGLPRVRHLHLQDNLLTSLSADILAPLTGMQVLNLARNRLTAMPADAFAALTLLTTLNLRGNQLASLPAGTFGDTPGLTHLYLQDNQLASLPDATFSGFTPGLAELGLQGNPGAPFALTANLMVDEDAKTVHVQVPLAAPEALDIPLTFTGGNQDAPAASLAAGTSSSDPQTVAFAADSAPVTASLDNLPTLSDGFTGIELVAGVDTVVIRNGICGHSSQVRDAILADANVTSTCGNVSADELAAVTGLTLNNMGIAALTADDFMGLTGLTSLNLSGNALTELPAGVFNGLAALTSLNLADNALAELPAGVFADLTALATLNLGGNAGAPFSFAVDLAAAETAAGFDISATVADGLPTPAGSLTVYAQVHADLTTSAVRSFTPPAALSVAATVNLAAVSALCFGETPTDSDGTGCTGINPSFTGVQLTAGAAIVVDPHPTFDGVTVADLTVLQRAETSLQLPEAIAMVPTGMPAPTFTYSLTASAGGTQLAGMPAGLAFDAATRTLSGRPGAPGIFSMDYGVRDDNGDADSLSFTLTVIAQDNHTYRNLHAQILSRFAITVADNAGQAIADRVDRMVRGQKPQFLTNAEATEVEIPFKGAWSIWTQDERTQTTQSTAADWDWSGDVASRHTGIDWQSPGSTLVLGVMAQDSEGSFSYTGRAGAVASLAGDYRTPLTGEHFYLGWSPRGQSNTSWFTFWMASGSGSGRMNLAGIGGPNLRSDIDLDTSHFSIAITPVNVMRGLRLKLRAEMSTADLSLAASEGVDPMSLEVTRERLLLEPSTPSLLNSDHQQLTLSGELGTRTDSTSVSGFATGDITGLPQGDGLEYGLKLRYTWRNIDIEAGARSMQLDSDEGSYEEAGYFVNFSLGSCKSCSHNRGFSMSLSPTWGNTSSGAQRLWGESHLSSMGGSDAGTDTARSLSTEFSYGLALPVGGRAVMVPYSRLQTGGGDQWSTAFGTRLKFADNFELSFERTGQFGGQSSTAGELKLGATFSF